LVPNLNPGPNNSKKVLRTERCELERFTFESEKLAEKIHHLSDVPVPEHV
jgi:hypothetical protein